MIVSLAICIWMASGESRAKETIELTPDNVVTVWQNINEVILVLSANIAMDDEWVDGLRNLQPAADTTNTAAEMTTFREKLNTLLASSNLDAVAAPNDTRDATSVLYVNSGTLLDNLVYYLIDADSLASVAIYYREEEINGSSSQDVVAQMSLANQRLDAFIEESGL